MCGLHNAAQSCDCTTWPTGCQWRRLHFCHIDMHHMVCGEFREYAARVWVASRFPLGCVVFLFETRRSWSSPRSGVLCTSVGLRSLTLGSTPSTPLLHRPYTQHRPRAAGQHAAVSAVRWLGRLRAHGVVSPVRYSCSRYTSNTTYTAPAAPSRARGKLDRWGRGLKCGGPERRGRAQRQSPFANPRECDLARLAA